VRDRPWALVLLGTLGLGATFARPEAAATFVVRSGGALALIPMTVGLVGLALPALLVEHREEQPLPKALSRHGSAGELLGWMALCQAWWVGVWASIAVAAGVMVGLAWLRGADPRAALLDPSSALVPAVPWLLALIVARRRRTAELVSVGVAAGVALVLITLLVGLTTRGVAAVPLLLDARPGLLARPPFWLEGIAWAMTLAAAGAGISRARGIGGGGVLAGVCLAGALALAGAVAGAVAMAPLHAWPDAWSGSAWSRWLVRLGEAPGGGAALWARALVPLLVASVWVTATVEALSSAIADKWRKGEALWLPATLGMIASVAFALPYSIASPDLDTSAALFGHLLTPWIFGLGLPACAAALCWLARGEAGAVAAAVDPWNRLHARLWLPPLVRWVAPAIGAVAIVLLVATSLREGLPGQSLAVRGLGRLDEVAYVVVPIVWALSTFVGSTALTWLHPGAELPREGVTA
jgi:hypothetical protein